MSREARGAARLLSVAMLALASLVMVVGGHASAGVGKTVSSAEIDDGTLQCADFNAAVGACPFGAGGGGGGGGGSASGIVQNYNAKLTANQVKSVTIGNFTFSEAALGTGACSPTGTISAGAVQGSATNATGFPFGATVPANGSTPFNWGAGASVPFSVIADDGASTMNGIVIARTQGATCLTGGFIAGV